ncbi:MAG TPA: serine/threonine-protein kinase, partial [Gemmataceae bacterium]|nr:serine/threonine-protein kinase [Gemmataceae bacterium]
MAEQPTSPRPTGASESLPRTVALPTPDKTFDQATLNEDQDTARQAASGHGSLPMRSFGDFELLEEIGRGSMGLVYRARERHSGRLVALKMMLDQPGREGGNRRRFALEARATGQLSHPGIVTIHAWGEHEGHPFYTMDYVPGTLLSRILEDGPLPCERAVHYLAGMARAVAAAHALGIVHRDLKPGNVIIDADDQPRVLDFGLAKRLSTTAGGPTPLTIDTIAGILTSELASRQTCPVDTPGSKEGRG